MDLKPPWELTLHNRNFLSLCVLLSVAHRSTISCHISLSPSLKRRLSSCFYGLKLISTNVSFINYGCNFVSLSHSYLFKGEQHLKSVLRERKEEKCNLLPHLLHIHSLGLIIHLGLTLGKHTQPICFEKPLLMNSPVLEQSSGRGLIREAQHKWRSKSIQILRNGMDSGGPCWEYVL